MVSLYQDIIASQKLFLNRRIITWQSEVFVLKILQASAVICLLELSQGLERILICYRNFESCWIHEVIKVK